MATATAGIMIGVILQTGLAIRFTSFLVDFAGGSLFLALVITMLAAIILGTALPTTPAYIMLAALLIPALIKLGVPPLAAHMFAFYFGCLSAVTPPECLAVYAAASISRCSVWAAGWHAMRFAAAGFIVPFFFVYYPALLFQGSWGEITQAVVSGGDRRGLPRRGTGGLSLPARDLAGAGALRGRGAPAHRSPPAHGSARAGVDRDRDRLAEAPAPRCLSRGPDRSRAMSRAQQVALTLIAGALVLGTLAYGVLRLYAS